MRLDRKYRDLLLILGLILFSSSNTIEFSRSHSSNFNYKDAINIEQQFCVSHSRTNEPILSNLQSLGVSILRGNIEWVECVKNKVYGSRIYDFSKYDEIIANLDSIGTEFLGCFVYGWGVWPEDSFYELPQEEWPDYFDFVKNFTLHFKDNITYYEIWNEPDIGFWRQTDEEFYMFSREIVQIIRESDPTCKILSPGVTGPNIPYLEDYITNLTDASFNEMFDILAYHAYGGTDAEFLSERIWKINDFIERHNFSGDVWITEVGLSTAVSNEEMIDAYQPELIDQQGAQVLQTYAQTIAGNVSSTFWYCMLDWCDVSELNGEGRFGLMYCAEPENSTYDFKPSGYAFQMLEHLIDQGVYFPHGCEQSSLTKGNLWSYYYYTPQNTTASIIWSQNLAQNAKVSLRSPISIENKVHFDLKYYDYFTNTTSSYHDQTEFSLNLSDPVLIELNYSSWLDENSFSSQPLTLIIELKNTIIQSCIIIGMPILLGIGIILNNFKKKELNFDKKKLSGVSLNE